MDILKLAKWNKDLIVKAWGRCKSLGSINTLSRSNSSRGATTTRSASFKHNLKRSFTTGTSSCTASNANDDHQKRKEKKKSKKGGARVQVAPDGCFSVYVGPEKQRFVVRAEFANHPLFRMLLEDAESEYGYSSDGPILLPCEVDLFYKVLAEMERGDDDHDQDDFIMNPSPGCSLILCSPLHKNGVGHGYGGYKLLSPSRLLKINQF